MGDGEHSATEISGSEEFNSLFEDAPCGYVVFDERGVISRVNRTFLRMVDAEAGDLVGERLPSLFSTGSRLFYETHLHPLLTVNGTVNEVALDLERLNGDRVPVLLSATEARWEGAQHRNFRAMLVDIGERRRIEDDLRSARHSAERRARRLAALHHVSEQLSMAVGPDDVADAVVVSARSVLDVDTIVIWRLDRAGQALHPISVATSDGDTELPVAVFDRSKNRPHWKALDSGEAVTLKSTSAHYASTVSVMDGAGHREVRFVPFEIGSKPGGVISVAFPESKELDPEDEAILFEVVGQAAVALERAELYAQQRDIALTWQKSLMAHDIPRDERIEIRSFYAPAAATFRAGGDWFDVVRLDDNRFCFIVGDVVGHGMEAAGAMGQLRSAANALALSGHGPSDVLDGLDRFACRTDGTLFATVVCGDLDLTSGMARIARAGHVPPVLFAATGPRTVVDGGGPPLAVGDGRRPPPAEVGLDVGDRLLFYTDGLIERRNETLDDGMRRLVSVFDRTTDRPINELALESATSQHGDDICVLEVTRLL